MKQWLEYEKEVRDAFEETKELDHKVREEAMDRWVHDMSARGDMTSRSWMMATITVLVANGYEIKKKV